jgi:hypothetical protein
MNSSSQNFRRGGGGSHHDIRLRHTAQESDPLRLTNFASIEGII